MKLSADEVIEELRDRIDVLETRLEELEEQGSSGGFVREGTEIREFFNETNPSTHVEKSTTIGYFLENARGYESFTANDIEEGYVECKVSLPANMADVLAGAANRTEEDWVMQVGEGDVGRYYWTLTQAGEAAVEDGFNQ